MIANVTTLNNLKENVMNKIYISWEDLQKDTKELCEKIKARGEYNKIVAVSRGGLIPAGIASYELDLRNVETINILTYDGEIQRNSSDIELLENIVNVDEKTIIIDDLSDTGNTCNILRKIYPKAMFAVVYVKPQGKTSADIYGKEVEDRWIVFPWD